MAYIITITNDDTKESIQQKIKQLAKQAEPRIRGFDAKMFTGKIKSYRDGISYQSKLRDEWL